MISRYNIVLIRHFSPKLPKRALPAARHWSSTVKLELNNKSKSMLKMYDTAMLKHPILTSAAVAGFLWSCGDYVAQKLEQFYYPKQRFDQNRLAGTVLDATLVGGIGSFYWYSMLDKAVSSTFKFVPGTLKFVAAKIALEYTIWIPISLFSFWTIVGHCQGYNFDHISRELQRDFFPTLFGMFALWLPLDLFMFWRVPVSKQVLFISIGSFIEAVGLSYCRAASEEFDDDLVRKTHAGRKRPEFLIRSFTYKENSIRAFLEESERQFNTHDINHKGYLTKEELAQLPMLPGLKDPEISKKIATILMRKIGVSENDRITKREYMSLVSRLHETGYRKSFMVDVIFSLFDINNDGYIDEKELTMLMAVMNGQTPSEEMVLQTMKWFDVEKNGKISKDELKNGLIQNQTLCDPFFQFLE